MKKHIFILFLIVSWTGYGQQDQTVLISNNQNFDKSIFADIDLKENETSYSLKVNIKDFGRYDFRSKSESKHAGAMKMDNWSGIYFNLEENSSVMYIYPIHKKFLKNKLSNIYDELIRSKKAKLNFTIYKTDSTPIIVINKVSELE